MKYTPSQTKTNSRGLDGGSKTSTVTARYYLSHIKMNFCFIRTVLFVYLFLCNNRDSMCALIGQKAIIKFVIPVNSLKQIFIKLKQQTLFISVY